MKIDQTSNINIGNLVQGTLLDYLKTLDFDLLQLIQFFNSRHQTTMKETMLKNTYKLTYHITNFLKKTLQEFNVTDLSILGDFHRQGKCTLSIETNNDRFIYKPVNTMQFKILHEALYTLNSCGLFTFRTIKFHKLTQSFAIIKWIDNEDIENLEKFAFHYGALILIITLFRGVDFHPDNIFCVDSTPIIIDCETMFFPIICSIKDYDVEATSLLTTKYNNNTFIDKIKSQKYYLQLGIKAAKQVIENNGKPFQSLITKGLYWGTRLIFKPTRYYYTILKKSLHPTFIINETKRRKYLCNCLQGTHVISKAIKISEIEDLMQLQIPYFRYYQGILYNSSGHIIQQKFLSSPLEHMLKSIKKIGTLEKELLQKMETLNGY